MTAGPLSAPPRGSWRGARRATRLKGETGIYMDLRFTLPALRATSPQGEARAWAGDRGAGKPYGCMLYFITGKEVLFK